MATKRPRSKSGNQSVTQNLVSATKPTFDARILSEGGYAVLAQLRPGRTIDEAASFVKSSSINFTKVAVVPSTRSDQTIIHFICPNTKDMSTLRSIQPNDVFATLPPPTTGNPEPTDPEALLYNPFVVKVFGLQQPMTEFPYGVMFSFSQETADSYFVQTISFQSAYTMDAALKANSKYCIDEESVNRSPTIVCFQTDKPSDAAPISQFFLDISKCTIAIVHPRLVKDEARGLTIVINGPPAYPIKKMINDADSAMLGQTYIKKFHSNQAKRRPLIEKLHRFLPANTTLFIYDNTRRLQEKRKDDEDDYKKSTAHLAHHLDTPQSKYDPKKTRFLLAK